MPPISAGIVYLAAHQTQDELMILLEQTWRVDEITFGNCIEKIGNRHLRLDQFRRIGLNLKLRYLAALQNDHGHAEQPIKSRLDGIVSQAATTPFAGCFAKSCCSPGSGTPQRSGDWR